MKIKQSSRGNPSSVKLEGIEFKSFLFISNNHDNMRCEVAWRDGLIEEDKWKNNYLDVSDLACRVDYK